MGLVYKYVSGQMGGIMGNQIKPYANPGQVVMGVTQCVYDAGKPSADVPAADITAEEVDTLAHKLDTLAADYQNDAIAKAIAEVFPSIVLTVRRVKKETGSIFSGILGNGANLDIKWLRAKDIGYTILNPALTAVSGIYGGVTPPGGGYVSTYLQTFVANTAQSIIPAQRMLQWAACIHIGLYETIEIPKITDVTFTLDGQPTGPQSVFFDSRRMAGESYDTSFVRFEKPVMVSPMRLQQVSLMPNISGDSKPEMISLVVARISDLIATV